MDPKERERKTIKKHQIREREREREREKLR